MKHTLIQFVDYFLRLYGAHTVSPSLSGPRRMYSSVKDTRGTRNSWTWCVDYEHQSAPGCSSQTGELFGPAPDVGSPFAESNPRTPSFSLRSLLPLWGTRDPSMVYVPQVS